MDEKPDFLKRQRNARHARTKNGCDKAQMRHTVVSNADLDLAIKCHLLTSKAMYSVVQLQQPDETSSPFTSWVVSEANQEADVLVRQPVAL